MISFGGVFVYLGSCLVMSFLVGRMSIRSWHILESGLVLKRAPKSVKSRDILFAIEKST